MHPSTALENNEGDGKADALLKGQGEVNNRDGPVEHESGKKSQGYTEKPCTHQIDDHDVCSLSTAAQDAASDDHVQNLERHNCGVSGENLNRQFPNVGIHIENAYI